MDIKIIALVGLLGLLVGCSGGSSGTPTVPVTITQPDPTTPVAGGGVKGPLVNATVNLYLLDLAASDLKGNLISSGSTNSAAAIQGLTIASGSLADTFILEVIADDDTTDLNTGLAPILTRYETIVGSSDIRNGQVFATPVTTLIISLALQSGPFADQDALDDALALASQQVISSLGFGLDVNTNPFTSNPLLTVEDSTEEQQAAVLAYRLAVEGVAAILELLTAEVRNADADSTVSVDDVLNVVAADLADGSIDGQADGANIETFSGVTNIASVVATDPGSLMIPGTDRPITAVAEFVASEVAVTGVTVSTSNITSGTVTVDATPARTDTDIDGDGVIDRSDAFPTDPLESIDTDLDGTGNNSDTDDDNDNTPDELDAFPLNPEEDTDTDADGVGNNEDTDDDGDGVVDSDDALPLDRTETVDTDSDGIGNNADSDDDGDGVNDNADAFPLLASEQLDTDLDGVGNNEDTDDDGDGVADVDDRLPLDARASAGTSATIGAAGGTLMSADGQMTLTFPAGALTEDTEIIIGNPTATSTDEFNNDDFAVEAHYLLEPDGIEFVESVDVAWMIPAAQPSTMRFVYTLSGNELLPPDEPNIVDPNAGLVTAKISHFSDLFVITGAGLFAINVPIAKVNEELTWIYEYDIQDENLTGTLNTEGAFLADSDNNLGAAKQPTVSEGEDVITAPAHERLVFCTYKDASGGTVEECFPSSEGSVVATCLDSSEEGLKTTINFGIEFERFVELIPDRVFFPESGRGVYQVQADGFCRDSREITEPTFIAVGEAVDRIESTPEDIVIPECDAAARPYDVVVSNTRTSLINSSGCSRDLNFDANSNQSFGSQLLIAGDESRLFTYGESGVFIVLPEDGVFGQLSDFLNTTTDLKHAVDDNGSVIPSQAYSVNNAGSVKLRTLNSDGSNTDEEAFSAFSVAGAPVISYAPISSSTGVAITSSGSSKVFFVDHGGNTPTGTEIGSVGDTALGVYCTRLSCASSSNACSITNDETVGCAASAFNSEELYTFYSSNVLSGQTFNFTVPIPGVVTASPFIKSNSDGQMVIATVNDNEIGKVQLIIQTSDGTEVQKVELFLTDYENVTGFVANGSSIVLLEPSVEYPNGAIRIGLQNKSGEGDGVLTIPVTEELLGTSPEPFFGPTFSN